MKKIALSGSRAKLKILNGKIEEGFLLLKSTAQKFKSFATDLADRVPQALAARISLDLFSHFESKSSKRLGIPKGIVLGGVLALMSALPAVGQTINAPNTAALITAINTANGNPAAGIIHLEQGTTYTLGANLPIVTGSDVGGTLQIICTGTTNAIIDGNNAHRPITMDSNSDLMLSKITIQNGFVSNGSGGAISNRSGNLTISNSLITNNGVTGAGTNGRGSGLYSESGNVSIQNSTFSLNSATTRGGAIYSTQSAIMSISSSSLTENFAATEGGAIFNSFSANITITCSSIAGNATNFNGGGIRNNNNSSLSVISSFISGNTALSNGGGIDNSTNSSLTISNSSISGNISGNRGGGIHNYNNSVVATISSSTISGNSAVNGGGIFNDNNSTLNIFSSSISSNSVTNNGGGISNHYSPLNIQASTIASNQSGQAGGGFYIKNGSVTIQNTTISSNNSLTNGGAGIFDRNVSGTDALTLQHVTLSANDGNGVQFAVAGVAMNVNLQNTIIANSTAADFTLGGATLSLVTATISGDGTLVHANAITVNPLLNGFDGTSHTLQAGSPAIDAASTADATTNDQLGVLRVAPHDIGAVQFAVAAVACPIDVTTNADTGVGSLRQAILDANANISDCVIYLDGGETYTIASNLPIVTGTDVGGTLSIISTGTLNAIIDGNNLHRPLTMTSGSNLTLSKITIQNGSANQGGAIYNTCGDLRISNSIVSNNAATAGNGGAIYSTGNGGSASVLIQNSTISMNTASVNGGGISNRDNSSLTISSSSISGNTVGLRGGGVFNRTNSPLTISNTSVFGNTSNNLGGGIFNYLNSSLTISSSSISGNTATTRGGGVWLSDSNMNVQASSFTTNQSGTQGGAMMIYGAFGGGRNTLIQNTTISGNSSTGNNGGGIYHESFGGVNNISFQHVTLSDNTGNGGAGTGDGFHNNGASSISLQNSIIANSTGAGSDFHLGAASSIVTTATIIETSTSPITSATVIDPMLNALSGGVHTLQAGSPAIDAASTADATTNDQLGVLRVAPHDIGAVQFGVVACITVASTPADATNTWIGCTNSDWNTATNWSTGAVPVASDVVYVPIEAVNQLIIDEVATCAKLVVQIGAKCLVNYNAGGKLLIKF